MDAIDRKILTLLQKDASISLAKLAAQVNLTTTPCWKRVQRLERDGYITKRVVLVAPEKINLKQAVLVTVKTAGLSEEVARRFVAEVSAMPQVMEFYQVDDEDEYVMRVIAADRDAYNAFQKQLVSDYQLKNVTPHFITQSIKTTTAYPVPPATGRK